MTGEKAKERSTCGAVQEGPGNISGYDEALGLMGVMPIRSNTMISLVGTSMSRQMLGSVDFDLIF